ncbi:MAG: hypothetical protein O3B87_02630 [bacterium]|nr:hypothetical protein [bacterium]
METEYDILEQQAIEAAMNSNWEEAVALNKKITKLLPEEIPAFQRLGYALLQTNKLQDAAKQFKMVLKLQPNNNIAEDHLEKIEILLDKKKNRHTHASKYNSELFLDIPGKTRTISLVTLGKKEDLAGLNVGEEIILKEKRRKLEARSRNDEYIGCLPDDISKRISYFMQEGSEYRAYIKAADLSEVVIFISEVFKGKKVERYPSFPANPHVMLSDIHHLSINEDDDDNDDSDDDDPAEDEGLNDNEWEEFESRKDLSGIVQMEDEGGEDEE